MKKINFTEYNLQKFLKFAQVVYYLSIFCICCFAFSCSKSITLNSDIQTVKHVPQNENYSKLLSEIDLNVYFIGFGRFENSDKRTAEKTANIIALANLSKNITIEITGIIKSYEEHLQSGDKTYTNEELDVIIAAYSETKLKNVKYKQIFTEKNSNYIFDVVAYKDKEKYLEEAQLDILIESIETNEIKKFLLNYLKENM